MEKKEESPTKEVQVEKCKLIIFLSIVINLDWFDSFYRNKSHDSHEIHFLVGISFSGSTICVSIY